MHWAQVTSRFNVVVSDCVTLFCTHKNAVTGRSNDFETRSFFISQEKGILRVERGHCCEFEFFRAKLQTIAKYTSLFSLFSIINIHVAVTSCFRRITFLGHTQNPNRLEVLSLTCTRNFVQLDSELFGI